MQDFKLIVEVEPGRKATKELPEAGPVYRAAYATGGFPTLPGISSCFELFEQSCKRYPCLPCLGERKPIRSPPCSRSSPSPLPSPFVFRSFADVSNEVAKVSSGLAALGVARGDRIGIIGSNSINWMVGLQATNRQALCCVPLYETFGEAALKFVIAHSGMKVVLADKRKVGAVVKALSGLRRFRSGIVSPGAGKGGGGEGKGQSTEWDKWESGEGLEDEREEENEETEKRKGEKGKGEKRKERETGEEEDPKNEPRWVSKKNKGNRNSTSSPTPLPVSSSFPSSSPSSLPTSSSSPPIPPASPSPRSVAVKRRNSTPFQMTQIPPPIDDDLDYHRITTIVYWDLETAEDQSTSKLESSAPFSSASSLSANPHSPLSASDVAALSAADIQVLSWSDLANLGSRAMVDPIRADPEEICTVMYTSGTTGLPKGVMLSHRSILATIASVRQYLDELGEEVGLGDAFLSYLPLAHIFDRVVEELMIYSGSCIGYWQGDVRKVTDDIMALRPTIFAGVPRVFDRIYAGILQQLRGGGEGRGEVMGGRGGGASDAARGGKDEGQLNGGGKVSKRKESGEGNGQEARKMKQDRTVQGISRISHLLVPHSTPSLLPALSSIPRLLRASQKLLPPLPSPRPQSLVLALRKWLFQWALTRKRRFMRQGHRHDVASPLADRLVFHRIKRRLGGRVRVLVSGGAPLSPHIEEFMRVALCAPVVQGYGLTETCAASFIAAPWDMSHVGTVGPPQAATELRLEAVPDLGYFPCGRQSRGEEREVVKCEPVSPSSSPSSSFSSSFSSSSSSPSSSSSSPSFSSPPPLLRDSPTPTPTPTTPPPQGEILIRSPTLFSGYFRDPILTKSSLDPDGFFRTGDIGELIQNGTLRVIDRRKNIFKLSQGEYIASEKVENVYKSCAVADQVWVYGDSLRSCLVAVVVPVDAELRRLMATKGGDGGARGAEKRKGGGEGVRGKSQEKVEEKKEEKVEEKKEDYGIGKKQINKRVLEKNLSMSPPIAMESSGGLDQSPLHILCQHPKAKEAVLKLLVAHGQENGLSSLETIQGVHLDPNPFTVENDLLTPTFKLKRAPLLQKYGAVINQIYDEIERRKKE